jgi:hypothetical protein
MARDRIANGAPEGVCGEKRKKQTPLWVSGAYLGVVFRRKTTLWAWIEPSQLSEEAQWPACVVSRA